MQAQNLIKSQLHCILTSARHTLHSGSSHMPVRIEVMPRCVRSTKRSLMQRRCKKQHFNHIFLCLARWKAHREGDKH